MPHEFNVFYFFIHGPSKPMLSDKLSTSLQLLNIRPMETQMRVAAPPPCTVHFAFSSGFKHCWLFNNRKSLRTPNNFTMSNSWFRQPPGDLDMTGSA
jgi:hypothetical protein